MSDATHDVLPLAHVLRARIGPLQIAASLHHFGSVLDSEALGDAQVIDPGPMLGIGPQRSRHVGLLRRSDYGPPLALGLGEVSGVDRWEPDQLLMLPDWLARHASQCLLPGCALSDVSGSLIWLLDVEALTAHARLILSL